MESARSIGAWSAVLLSLLGCGSDPEELLLGRWEEVEWRYEKFDGEGPPGRKWVDGFRFSHDDPAEVVRHEAEFWEFKPGRELEISLRNGDRVHSRWRLKGRGHVLTLRRPGTEAVELYDVKELGEGVLILNYDIGMEVRGIARLEFRRARPEQSADAGPRA